MAILTIKIFDNVSLEINDLTDSMGETARNAIDSLTGTRGLTHPKELSVTDKIVIELAEALSKVKNIEYPPEEDFLTAGLDDVVSVAIRILATQMNAWNNEVANSGMLIGVLTHADLIVDDKRIPSGLFNVRKKGDDLSIITPHPAILEHMETKYLTREDFDDTAINLARMDNHQPPLPSRLGSSADEQKLVWMNKLQQVSRGWLMGTALLLQDYAEELVRLTYNTQRGESNPIDPKAATPAKRGKTSTVNA